MVQRIQSVYLFLVVILMSFFILSPIAVFDLQDGSALEFYSYSVSKIMANSSEKALSTWPVLFLAIVIAIINFYDIFLYSNRMRQMRLAIYNMLLMIGMIVLVFYFYHYITKNFNTVSHSLKLAAILPVVCIVLNLLAFRGIRKDDLLVKSYERLRK